MSIINNMVDIWNAVGTVFTGVKLNVTDTASDPTSLLMDLQVGGVSNYRIAKNGDIQLNSNGARISRQAGAGGIFFDPSGVVNLNYGGLGFTIAVQGIGIGAADVTLARDAANTLALRNGTAAQTFNIYNTYTDASNYERLGVTWSSNIAFLQTTNGGTGQPRPIGYNANAHLFYIGNSLKWQIDGNGQISAQTDNANDIGTVGNSPRYIRAATSLITNGATVTTNTPTLNLAQTWNNVATTFTGAVLNVTDTTSAAASLLLDLQKGGVSQFRVDKLGNTTMTGSLLLGNSNNLYFGGGVTLLNMSPTTTLNWNNDVNLVRDAANTLALRNGTNGQRFNIYQTYTDVSNYSQGYFSASSSLFQIGTANAGTGTGMSLQLNSATSVIYCNGLFVPVADAGTDLGGGVNRWGNFYLGKNYIHNPTWNSAATTFTAMQLNVTDTASNPGSLLMDLQVGGTSKFKVDKLGNANTPAQMQCALATATSGFYTTSSTGQFVLGAANDVVLARDAANTLAQRNGTAAQTSRLYISYTDASNGVWMEQTGISGYSVVSTNTNGTGTSSGLILSGGSAAGAVRPLLLRPSVTATGWTLGTTGTFTTEQDNTVDLGIVNQAPRYIRAATSLITNGATVTVSTPTLNLAQTWNAAAVAFTGAMLNVTDTTSAAASLLMDLQVGGVSKFKVDKFGAATVVNALVVGAGVNAFTYSMNGDTILARDAANTLALRNGTAAQTFSVYNTYTDASNYERGGISWTSNANALTIGTSGAGTGSNARNVVISSSGGFIAFASNFGASWYMNGTGTTALYPQADNANDIGQVGNMLRYVRVASAIQTKALTVATLPAAATALAGARSFVTDATLATFGSTAVGGGANAVPVWTDGTTWKIG